MAPLVSFEVEGLTQFRASLKAMGKEWPRMLAKANKAAADVIVPVAQHDTAAAAAIANLSGHPAGELRKIAPTIRSVQSAVAAQIKAGKGFDFAFGAMLGSLSHPQFPAHIGSGWVAGEPGGPYGLGDAMVQTREQVMDVYWRGILDVAAAAFPN